MAAVPTQKVQLQPDDVVAADATLAAVAARLAHGQHPLLLVRDAGGGAWRGVLEADVRVAFQDGVDRARTVGDLARATLVADDEASALARLAAEPALPGVILRGGDPARATAVLRRTRPITTAAVLAGGEGRRLRPLTEQVPKPLLDVGGEPLLFRILRQLREAGIEKAFVSVNYLAQRIKDAVGDGTRFGLAVEFLEEERPLDTGAALSLMPRQREPFLVVNGDVLTTCNLRALGRWHQLAGALATVATYLFAAALPYGVVRRDGGLVAGIDEKPVHRYPVNAGIYAFSPQAHELVEHGQPLPMVPFLNDLIRAGRAVARFPMVEYWNDIGLPADYERAQADARAL
jgi:dTDP-glucose pyrophosphorylase